MVPREPSPHRQLNHPSAKPVTQDGNCPADFFSPREIIVEQKKSLFRSSTRAARALDRSSLPGLKKSSGAGRIDGSAGRRALPTSNIGPDTAIHVRNSGATPIDAPVRVDGEQSIPWDDRCDVLVVGFGAAGACAAIEAADAGSNVIVTDRFGGGGASAKR